MTSIEGGYVGEDVQHSDIRRQREKSPCVFYLHCCLQLSVCLSVCRSVSVCVCVCVGVV